MIAQGTDATGLDNPVRTRYRRGPVMREAIMKRQLDFSLIDPEEFPPRDPTGLPDPWIFLHYIDRAAGEIRSELSFPDGMDDEGYLTSWAERILLTPIAIASAPLVTRAPEHEVGPYEVPVRARPQ